MTAAAQVLGNCKGVIATFVSVAMFRNHAMGPVDEMTKAMIAPLVHRAALAQSFNEAWFLVAGLFATALIVLLCLRRMPLAEAAAEPD